MKRESKDSTIESESNKKLKHTKLDKKKAINDHDSDKSNELEDQSALGEKLKELLYSKRKLSSKKFRFILTLDDLKSFDKSMIDHEKKEWTIPPFFVQDLQRVLLFSLIGDQYRFFPRWCKILRPSHLKSVYFITINNFSELDYKKHQKLFSKFNKIFLNQNNNQLNSIEFISSGANGTRFIDEFISVPITRTQWLKIRDEDEFQLKRNQIVEKYRNLYRKMQSINSKLNKETNGKANERKAISTSDLDKIPRTSLLLNSIQMVREDYPLPFDNSNSHNYEEYVYTKDTYDQVCDKSPLYSIDCEMCYNEDGEMETVWLAIVDESLECIYETYIKPQKRIRNFLTSITGVSMKTLQNIEVTLKDVQNKIKELLPTNAILCGQSLNNDLHSLKMFHPYVIDTSIIYNLSGDREAKPSLKRLSAQFLGKLIQESSHNPAIDARASLQLVLLKLRRGLEFGDVIVGGCMNVYEENNIQQTVNLDLELSDPQSISKLIYQTGLNIDQNFFNVLRDNKISNLFIDNKNHFSKLKSNIKESSLCEDNNEALDLLESSLNDYKFIWTQLYLETTQTDDLNQQHDVKNLKKIIKSIRNIYEKVKDDSMLMIAFTGRSDKIDLNLNLNNEDLETNTNLNEYFKGRCFLKHKCEEMDQLEKEVKNLYYLVKPEKMNEQL